MVLERLPYGFDFGHLLFVEGCAADKLEGGFHKVIFDYLYWKSYISIEVKNS